MTLFPSKSLTSSSEACMNSCGPCILLNHVVFPWPKTIVRRACFVVCCFWLTLLSYWTIIVVTCSIYKLWELSVFSRVCVSFCSWEGAPHVTITHDALDITVQGPELSSLETWTNLFIWKPTPPLPRSDIWWWLLKHMRLAQEDSMYSTGMLSWSVMFLMSHTFFHSSIVLVKLALLVHLLSMHRCVSRFWNKIIKMVFEVAWNVPSTFGKTMRFTQKGHITEFTGNVVKFAIWLLVILLWCTILKGVLHV